MEIVQSRLGVHTNPAREDLDVVSIPYLKIADNGTKVKPSQSLLRALVVEMMLHRQSRSFPGSATWAREASTPEYMLSY
jgi:hypothetical protein